MQESTSKVSFQGNTTLETVDILKRCSVWKCLKNNTDVLVDYICHVKRMSELYQVSPLESESLCATPAPKPKHYNAAGPQLTSPCWHCRACTLRDRQTGQNNPSSLPLALTAWTRRPVKQICKPCCTEDIQNRPVHGSHFEVFTGVIWYFWFSILWEFAYRLDEQVPRVGVGGRSVAVLARTRTTVVMGGGGHSWTGSSRCFCSSDKHICERCARVFTKC